MRAFAAIAVVVLAGPAFAQHDMQMGEGAQQLELHFAADFDYRRSFESGAAPGGFALGSIDNLVHARLSDTITFLSEVVFEGSEAEGWGLDVERLAINWQPKRWFQLSAGRFHTPLGYWNIAYHHARWMMTTVDQPLLMRYEDQAGPLPLHTIGILAHGVFPAGPVRLEYDAAIGNGRGPASDPPQSFGDQDDAKSVVAGLHVLFGGLRFGVSGVWDQTHKGSATGPLMHEAIGAADLHYASDAFELIAEGALIHHRVLGVDSTDLGGYVQLSVNVTDTVRPYARAERYEHDAADDYLPTPTTTEVLGGVRVDLLSSLALKVEGAWVSSLGADRPTARTQLSWLF